MNEQEVSKPAAAYYLTIIGGAIGVLLGVFFLFILVGVWIIIANVIMIVYAQRLMDHPMEHSKYGTYIIVLSILAGGNLLGLIGGILGVTHHPTPLSPTQPYTNYSPYGQPQQYPVTGYCRLCGGPLTADAQFCPHCGKPVQTLP